MLNKLIRQGKCFSSLHPKIRSQSSGKEEAVREEFKQMFSEFEELMEKTMPLIKTHYLECGRPLTYKFNNFSMPLEIHEALGPLPKTSASIDECVESIR